MKTSLRLVGTWVLLLLISASWAQEKSPGVNQADTVIWGKPFNFPLSVRAFPKVIGRPFKSKLKSFDLRVEAEFLGQCEIKEAASAKLPTPQPVDSTFKNWFWRHVEDPLEYRPYDKQLNNLWRNSVQISKRLYELGADGPRAYFVIHSQFEMAKNDTIELGSFDFQPDKPGLYRLTSRVFREKGAGYEWDIKKRQVTGSQVRYVYFKCPDYTPSLQVESDSLLHYIHYTRLDIPLVNSAFFEKSSAAFNANLIDGIFRNVFIGTVAARMACKQYAADFPILYDEKIEKESFEIGKARAQKLQAVLQEKMTNLTNGQSCEAQVRIREAKSEEWSRYIKGPSKVAQEMFSQENRVIPMVLDPATQRVVFAPLTVNPQEKSDEVVLTVHVQPQTYWENCIRSAEIVVTNSQGNSEKETLPAADLPKILRGEQKIRLSSSKMQRFLRYGHYTARLHLEVDCPTRELWSNPVSFYIKDQVNVIRDEIFALNPYDKVIFAYEFDYDRVDSLAHLILQMAQDTLRYKSSPQPPEVLVLISGHACILGEAISPFYNLGLSFGRAIFLRDLLLTAIRKLKLKCEMEVQRGAEICVVKRQIRESIRNEEITKIIDNCFQASDGKALEAAYEDYLQRITREKIRHFDVPSDPLAGRPADVPDTAQIRQRIEEIKHLLPGNLLTVTLKHCGKTVNVHFVSVGFGAAVPFYRHFEMPEKMSKAFVKMGIEVPHSFYGDDRYPSGRLMNRRVEVNLIW